MGVIARQGGAVAAALLFFCRPPVLVLITPANAVGHKNQMKGLAGIMKQFTLPLMKERLA